MVAMAIEVTYGKPNAQNSREPTENGDSSGNIVMLQLCKHETRS